jgi:dienelactone hydrolase
MRWPKAMAVAMVMTAAGAAMAQQAQGPVGTPTGPWREQIYWIPASVSGQQYLLYTRVCRPSGDAPARVVVIAHGTPADVSVRPRMVPTACESEAARWFLDRGFVVVASMRRGYGATGGPMADWNGACGGERDYTRSGRAAATDIGATIDYAATLPFAKPTGILLVGQSAGGWGSIAYNSQPHPRVTAIVNMAGGTGGHFNQIPNNNCMPERLESDAGVLGRSATTPMLWIYTENDSFFAPQIAAAMYAAYSSAGGKAEFYQLGAFGNDGHQLFFSRGGSAIWGPLIERYLATRPAQ